jgi:hypothetical protein
MNKLGFYVTVDHEDHLLATLDQSTMIGDYMPIIKKFTDELRLEMIGAADPQDHSNPKEWSWRLSNIRE